MIRFRQAAGWCAAVAAVLVGGMATAWAGADGKQPQKPFRIYGNTYYVGSAGHSSVLVVSDYGQVLIDTGPKEIAAQVAANIQELGFRMADLKAILVSDARPEHAGGASELQKMSGAQIYTMRPGDQKLRSDKPLKNDPRDGAKVGASPLVPQVWVVQDGQLLGIASVRLRSLATPGGAPEGVSWSWDACDGSKCVPAVYAASFEAETRGRSKDELQKSLQDSLAQLERVSCELLLTPDPAESGGLARLEQAGGKIEAVKQEGACKAYVTRARVDLARRLGK
jgi:metallo-beta-lactamase class B